MSENNGMYNQRIESELSKYICANLCCKESCILEDQLKNDRKILEV